MKPRRRGMAIALFLLVTVMGFGCTTGPQRTDNPGPNPPKTTPKTDDQAVGLAQVPAPIQVPRGAQLLDRFHAVGAQVYRCTLSTNGTPAWTLKAPAAELFDAKENQIGTHGEGPSWTSKDGSSVRGKKVAQVDAPRDDAIPWLLIQAIAHEGDGMFSRVEYVQRVNTMKGKAPISGCDTANVGAEASADYSADYYFYGATK